jgi:hypothetical protein
VDDKQIMHTITELVDEEHVLRARRIAGEITTDEENARLRDLEESLDQLWDLLRRRRAAREVGVNPDEVQPQSKDRVEKYLQ